MTKLKFLSSLHDKLSGLPQDEVEERLSFYGEMIEDRMEEGLSEAEAVQAVGDVNEIAARIIADMPLSRIVKEKIKPEKRLKTWEIVMLILGSPVWFSLLIAALAVILSLYISLWAVILSCWSAFAAVAAGAFYGVAAGGILAVTGHGLEGAAVLGTGIFCMGLSIFLFYGCKVASKGSMLLARKTTVHLKKCFVGKGAAQ